ncbi:MAG: hypothetical protein KC777_24165 [Cyanobacteria bacterium HKST-UBA02]|nr:hypothetical protein [Cyanobacteria bacterium HKST-UBA02]
MDKQEPEAMSNSNRDISESKIDELANMLDSNSQDAYQAMLDEVRSLKPDQIDGFLRAVHEREKANVGLDLEIVQTCDGDEEQAYIPHSGYFGRGRLPIAHATRENDRWNWRPHSNWDSFKQGFREGLRVTAIPLPEDTRFISCRESAGPDSKS